MAWADAVTQLRTRLYDTDTSKLRWRKKVFGSQDGTNKTFKTFEDRRITNFTTAVAPTGVFVNDAIVTVTADDTNIGEFTLTTAPATNADLRATYYARYFIDTELQDFLGTASEWLTSSTNFDAVTDGLKPSALCYAAAEAYQNLAIRAADMPSEQYRLEDSPDDKTLTPADNFMKMSEAFRKQAKMLRDHFYTRQGKSLQPLHNAVIGKVPNIP